MKLSLLFFSLVVALHPAMAEVNHWKAESSRTWPFLRGNIEFTLTHPLRIFHGRIEKMGGSVNLDPEDVNKGMQIQLQGNTRDAIYEDPHAKGIQAWIGTGTDWSIESHAFIARGGGDEGRRIEPIYNFTFGGKTVTDKFLATCSNDVQVLRCRFDTRIAAPRMGISVPKLMGIPSQSLVAVRGEVVFGEKEGPQ